MLQSSTGLGLGFFIATFVITTFHKCTQYNLLCQIFRLLVRTIETKDFAWKGYFLVALLFITATTQVIYMLLHQYLDTIIIKKTHINVLNMIKF